MGQDYIEGKNDQAKRGWNKASFSRRQPALFDRKSSFKSRTVTATSREGQSVTVGDKLLMIVRGQSRSIAKGNTEIADCPTLPVEIANKISSRGGVLAIEVVKVNSISNTFEICVGTDDET